jgi:hypothetical protein
MPDRPHGLTLTASAGGASATTYDYTTTDVPGSIETGSLGINDSGAVTLPNTASSIWAEPTPSCELARRGTAINDSGEAIGGEGDYSFLRALLALRDRR